LADRWEVQTLAGARPFYVVHAMMAFAAARRSAAAARVIDALPHSNTGGVSLSLPEDALAPPFCNALLAFAHSDYASCVDWLKRVRHIAHRCGGSLAQCDLIHLTFTEAALRARKARLARALVAERAAKKPGSRLNRLLQQRLRKLVPAIAGKAAGLPGWFRRVGYADVIAGRTEPRCAGDDLKLVDAKVWDLQRS
jgi:hypothetical protein